MLPNIGLVLVKGLRFTTRENSFYCTMRRWPEVRRVLIIPWIVLPHYVGGCGGSPAPHARHTASELSVEAVAALPSPQADLLGQLHVEFIPRVAKVLIIWKNAYARLALSQSMVPTAHS